MSAPSPQAPMAQAVGDHALADLQVRNLYADLTSVILARGVIYLLGALLLTLFVWSFFGKADVVVALPGQLQPESGTRRVYCPAEGELVEMYAGEGLPVNKGDLLARVKAPGAIQAAAQAFQERLRFEEARRELMLFPQEKAIMEKEINAQAREIKIKEKEHAQAAGEGLAKLSQAQRTKLEITMMQLAEAEAERDRARRNLEVYKKLYDSPGHGGIAQKQVEEKEAEFSKFETARNRLHKELQNLELEFSSEHTQTGRKAEGLQIELMRLRLQMEVSRKKAEMAESKVESAYHTAKAAWEAASQVSFSDLDEQNFLKITAPVGGVITNVEASQPGDKVFPSKPLVSIAQSEARKLMDVLIADSDRGLLKVGQPVRVKFSAFAYQRYGFIPGQLEYLAPAAHPSGSGQMAYKGRVSLERDHFIAGGERLELRYGMTGMAEVVVEKRRLIDAVLEPFRGLGN